MDDWEVEFEAALQETAKKSAPVKESIAPSSSKKTDQFVGKKIGSLRGEDDSIPLSDPILEKRRREQIIKQQEAELFGDLLNGCEGVTVPVSSHAAIPQAALAHIRSVAASDANRISSNELKTIKDCNQFVKSIGPVIDKSPAKSPAWLALMTGLLTHVLPKMSEVDIQTLEKKLAKQSAELVTAQKIAAQTKKKGFEKGRDQLKNFKDEVEMFYGNRDDDVDSRDEDYDD